MVEYGVHAAKTHFSKLLARVEEGEQVLICRNGRPVAKLVRVVDGVRPPQFGLLADAFDFDKVSFDASDEEVAVL